MDEFRDIDVNSALEFEVLLSRVLLKGSALTWAHVMGRTAWGLSYTWSHLLPFLEMCLLVCFAEDMILPRPISNSPSKPKASRVWGTDSAHVGK
jgi:hypothetical protein